MSRFLRNIIVAARDPGTSLRPRLPSLYASDPEPAAAHSSQEYTGAAGLERRHPAILDGTAQPTGGPDERSALIDPAAEPASAVLLPRLMEEPRPADRPTQHPATTSHDDGRHPSPTPAYATTLLDAARAWAGTPRAGVATFLRQGSAEARQVDGEDVAREPHRPSLPEPRPLAAARAQPVTAPLARRNTELEIHGTRTGNGGSASPSNDVEIHIGRIEVVAAAPTVRAPRKSAHPSPSLSDYLNGRRRPRT